MGKYLDVYTTCNMYFTLSKEEQEYLSKEDLDQIYKEAQEKVDLVLRAKKLERENNKRGLIDPSKYSILGRKVRRKYAIDFYYFSSINNENSYWAGFIAADGYIVSKNRAVGIKLQIRDKGHLEKFKAHCSYEGPINEYLVNTNKASNNWQCRFLVSGMESWISDLEINYSITTHKSLTLQPPSKLTIEHSLEYIKGMVDGDGCIITTKDNFRMELLCTPKIAEWTSSIVNSVTADYKRNDNSNIRVYRNTPALRVYQVGGPQFLKLASVLKDQKTPYLERKWDKVFQSI